MNMQTSKDKHLFNRDRLRALKKNLQKREKIIDAIRAGMKKRGYLEITTPTRILYPAPEKNIDPIPSEEFFLVTSPELQMKRLVAAGYEKIFQICPCFRKNEYSIRHLPEFTMLEWYCTKGTLETLKIDCENIVKDAASSVDHFPVHKYQNANINFSKPWKKIEVEEIFSDLARWNPCEIFNEERFEMDLVELIEPALPQNQPVFLTGYPAQVASLSRLDPTNPKKARRMELYIGGLELANGYEELTDAALQRKRFEDESIERTTLGKKEIPLDEDFLGALETGFPSCCGMAMGLDRLIMILTNSSSIQEVVPFYYPL